MAHGFSAAASAEFTAEEMDFIAQHQMVQIVPLFELGRLHFIGRGFGPFRARQPIDVPLWLAAELKKDGRCDMIAPPWLSVEGLEAVISSEKSDKLTLSSVHPHYQEIAASILRHDPACVVEADRVRSLLKDLEQLREAKILQSLRGMAVAQTDQNQILRFSNFSLMEVSFAACCSRI
jgi:GINS complex subunit 2